MSRYDLAEAARRDLFEIEDYISRDDPNASRRVVSTLFEAFDRIAEMPWIGRRRDDVKVDRYRFFPVRPYIVVYDPTRTPLVIVRVVHGHRDMPRLI